VLSKLQIGRSLVVVHKRQKNFFSFSCNFPVSAWARNAF